MRFVRVSKNGFGRLELLLVLSIVAITFQLFPSLWFDTLWVIDVRNWSRAAWLCVSMGVLLTLVGIRFGPDLMDEWRQRRERLAKEREKRDKQQALAEQRKLFERLREARKRQLF